MSMRRWRRRTARPAPPAADTGTVHPLVLSDERMASRISSVCFTVHVTGSWRWTHPAPADHDDPTVLARDHLRRQTAGILRLHSVRNLAAAQDAANSALMQWNRLESGLEVAGAAELDVQAADRSLDEEHARRQQGADLEHGEELHRLAHLQRVLADPDLRRVWWVARFPDRFKDLDELTTALKGLPLPQEDQDDDLRGDVRRFTDQLVTALHTPQQREVFLQALIQTLQALGHHDRSTIAALWRSPLDPGSTPE
ncbi:hypothetical protein ACFYXH_36430 [Streptomyces sp. NPDC002730]|uniref:hypothetical protein n=1 Tax=Streptomyces sp. NPDC002730 TaxID=3364662 RepID=UPI00368622F5